MSRNALAHFLKMYFISRFSFTCVKSNKREIAALFATPNNQISFCAEPKNELARNFKKHSIASQISRSFRQNQTTNRGRSSAKIKQQIAGVLQAKIKETEAANLFPPTFTKNRGFNLFSNTKS
jgi:hypothetical protein